MRLSLSLPALERLIGGDTEIEVELRHQIVERFAERHIKPLVNDTVFRQMSARYTQEMEGAVKKAIDELVAAKQHDADEGRAYAGGLWKLRDLIRGQCLSYINEALDHAVKTHVNRLAGEIQLFVKRALELEVQRQVGEALKETVESSLRDEVARLVAAGVRERIESVLKAT